MTKSKREIELEEKLDIAKRAIGRIVKLNPKYWGDTIYEKAKELAEQALDEITSCWRQQNDNQIANASKKVGE